MGFPGVLGLVSWFRCGDWRFSRWSVGFWLANACVVIVFWCSCATFEGVVFCVFVWFWLGWFLVGLGIMNSGFLGLGCCLICGCCGIGCGGFLFWVGDLVWLLLVVVCVLVGGFWVAGGFWLGWFWLFSKGFVVGFRQWLGICCLVCFNMVSVLSLVVCD